MAQLIHGTTIANHIAIHAGNMADHNIATTSYVTTQINNLIDGAPDALNTLNELAAALADDNNFAAAVGLSIAGKLSLSGGTMTGKILTVSTGTGTYETAMEIRETGYASTSQSAWGYSPAMTFHWGGRHAKRFGMRADGLFAVDDEPLALRSWVTDQSYLTSLPSHNHNDLYYTKSESDSRFVNTAGDTMTGNLTLAYSTANTEGYNALTFAPGSDDYIIKASTTYGAFGRSSFGWHINSASAFGVYSSGWVQLLGVQGDSGNVFNKGRFVVGGNFNNNAHSTIDSTRLHFGGGDDDANGNYYIGTNKENYGGNHAKLDLRWHTGIRMGAQPMYGGIRFFNNEDLGSRIMSIGETDANIRIDNNLWIGGAGGWITDLLSGKSNTGHTHDDRYYTESESDSRYVIKGSTQLPGSWPEATKFKSSGDIGTNTSGNHSLQIFADDGNDAFMAFHISSDFATFFGLENSTNRLYTGGWSDGNAKYQIWDSRDFSSSNISNWNTAYGWGNHSGLYASSSHTHDDRYYTESESDSRFVNASGDSMSGSLTLGAGAAYVGTHGDWTGEQNKIQWHSTHLYLQNIAGGNFFFRRADGTNLFNLDNNGSLIISGDFYPNGQGTYRLYVANSGLWTNGNFGASGDLYLGTRGTWLSSWLNQSVQTSANVRFSQLGLGAAADTQLSVAGTGHISDYLYLGGTAGTLNSWGTRTSGFSGYWRNASRDVTFNNEGYGTTWTFDINSAGAVKINRHIDANTGWGAASGNTIFVGWYGGKVLLGNNSDGGHDFANAITQQSIVSTNKHFFYKGAYMKNNVDGAEVLAVDGVNGRLFTVTDSLVDSIYSVNTISGLPVFEVFANSKVTIGKYGATSITIADSKIAINSDSVDPKFPFYVGDRSTSTSRYNLTNPGMGFNLADAYAQLQLYGTAGAYIDFTTGATDYQGRIMWNGSAFSIIGNMSWGGATLSNAVWNGTAISDSYISSASNWNTAFNKRPTGIAFSGGSTKTLTLTHGDGTTIQASFNDIDTDTNSDGQTLSISGSTLTISGGNSVTIPSGGMSEATANGRYLYYRGINQESDFQRFQDGGGEVRFDQVNDFNSLSNRPGGYNYGGVLSLRGDNFGFQLWASHTGDFFFKTQWNDDQYIGWRRVMDTTTYAIAANMNQYVRTSDDVTFSVVRSGEFYANGWFRNNGNNTGLYNQANGNHFYSRGAAKWGITGTGGNIHLEFRSNHETTLRGVVYADTGNQIGFLNNGEGWAFRTNSSNNAFVHGTELTINADGAGSSNIIMNDGDEGNRVIHCNSNRIGFLNQSGSWGAWLDDGNNWYAAGALYAPIFYDSENTAFYLDPSGASNIRNLYIGDAGSSWSDPGGWGTQITFSNGPHTKLVLQARTPGISAGMYVHTPGSVYIGSYSGHDVALMRAESARMIIYSSYTYAYGYLQAADSLRAPIFYDSDDTGYYADFNSTSNSAIRVRGGMLMGPNPTWGAYLQVGGNGHVSGEYANVVTTNGNLHLDSAAGRAIYLNNYANGIIYFNGGTYYISSNGSYYNGRSELVTINYNNNSDSTYQLLWGSGNSVYGTAQVYVNPNSDNIYTGGYRGSTNVGGTGEASWHPAGIYAGSTQWLYGTMYKNNSAIYDVSEMTVSSNISITGSNNAPINITGAAHKYLTINPGNGYEAMVRYIGGSGSSWYVGKRTSGQLVGTQSFHFYSEEAGATVGGIDPSGNMMATGSMRAPIFYDSGDTGYYLDPNDTSNLWRFTEATLNRHSLNSKQVNSPWSTRASQGSLYQTGAMGWGQVDLNVIASNWGSGFFDTWSSPANGPGASGHYVGMQAFHYNNSDSARFHGWQMACAQEANNRWFWRSAWDSPRSWVEMIHSGNIGSQTVSRSDGALKLWAESHPTDYYVRANWTGSYWQLTSNHPSGVQVAYANDSGYSSSSGTASRANRANGNFYIDDNFGNTVVGVYTSTRLQGVWAMGDAYKLAADGSSSSNHYGIAWSHPNAGGSAARLTSHGMLIQAAGNTWTAISDSIWCIGDITAFSDARVKTNIEVIDNPLERLSKVRGVTFNRTDLEHKDKRYAGVIAQEMREALPEVVTEDGNGELSVSYGNTVSLLIESIKAQQVQIEELKAEVKKLRGE